MSGGDTLAVMPTGAGNPSVTSFRDSTSKAPPSSFRR